MSAAAQLMKRAVAAASGTGGSGLDASIPATAAYRASSLRQRQSRRQRPVDAAANNSARSQAPSPLLAQPLVQWVSIRRVVPGKLCSCEACRRQLPRRLNAGP